MSRRRYQVNTVELTWLVILGGLCAGFVGALTGLGGGVVIVPLLTLVFGVDIRYAIGASLVSVIATSSGAAAAYVREGFSNIRLGLFLEIATTVGALCGAALATRLPTAAIAGGAALADGGDGGGVGSDAASLGFSVVPRPGATRRCSGVRSVGEPVAARFDLSHRIGPAAVPGVSGRDGFRAHVPGRCALGS